ncbi:MAG: M23 family metallopeptidase [Treponema sp.]|nr:M23 family metallopeptidase [Treponema sp.]
MFEKVYDKLDTLLNTRPKQIIASTIAAFCTGALMCVLALSVKNTIYSENGVGGFETPGIPQTNFAGTVSDENIAEDIPLEFTEGMDESILASETVTGASHEISDVSYLTYRVKPGDMIGPIADQYGITQDTIISVNGIRQSRLLQVGQYLKIPSIPGILYTVKKDGETPETIAKKFDVSAEKCAHVNSIETTAAIKAGATLFVPDAELDRWTLQEINGDLFRWPLRGGYYLSSYFGWRKSPFNAGARSYHTGIDLASRSGTPIFPALEGTVTTVSYNATYGHYVIINHHSGYKTLYGHMLERPMVRVGNYVYKTTQIGRVGSTGMSTGPHLHFTVFKNGKLINPLNVIQ